MTHEFWIGLLIAAAVVPGAIRIFFFPLPGCSLDKEAE